MAGLSPVFHLMRKGMPAIKTCTSTAAAAKRLVRLTEQITEPPGQRILGDELTRPWNPHGPAYPCHVIVRQSGEA
jgi:hypothetical protein